MKREHVEQFEHAGFRVTIWQDEDPQAPDDWGNDALFLVADHRDFEVETTDLRRPSDALDEAGDVLPSWAEKYHVFLLYAHIHSGVWLYLGRLLDEAVGREDARWEAPMDPGGWDTSMLGLVFVSKTEWPNAGKAEKAAEGLVETWNRYLSGDVYGYVIEARLDDGTWEDVDSCWGYYDIDCCRQEARSAAEANQRQVPLPLVAAEMGGEA